MGEVKIDQLEPGVKLSAEVLDKSGRVLIPAGAELSRALIDSLAARGIESVSIEDPPEPEPDPALIHAVETYLKPFFMYVNPRNEAVLQLYRHCVSRTARLMAQGWRPPEVPRLFSPEAESLADLFFRDEGRPSDLVRSEVELASFPKIYFKIVEVLKSPTSSASLIADVVSQDTSLAAKLLKLVNSPLYGFQGKIDSLTRAVTLVGAKELGNLAMGVSAISIFKDIPPSLVDMRSFWKHSLACAIFSLSIAEQTESLSNERMFLAGLLHDIGRLIMFKKLPHASSQALSYSRENSIPLHEAEMDIIGFDHALIGELLVNEWNFPDSLAQMIGRHHRPYESDNPLECFVVQLADNMAVVQDICSGGWRIVPGFDEKGWAELGLEIKFIEAAFRRFDQTFESVQAAFLLDQP